MRKKSKQYLISVVTYNKLDLLKKCLYSVTKNSPSGKYHVVVSCNGCTDGTWEYLEEIKEKCTWLTALHYRENCGFITPNLEVMQRFGASSKYFVTLNNDAEVPKGWLTKMNAVMRKNPKCALVGAKGSCNSFQRNGRSLSFQGVPGTVPEYIEGSCMMAKTEILEREGFFHPDMKFAYGEDVDLSLRLRSRGYSIAEANFKIKHQRAATSRSPELKSKIELCQRHNHLILASRWGGYLKTKKMNHTFLLKRTGAIGDVLLLEPLIRALRYYHPDSRIFVQTDCPQVLQNHPCLTAVQKRFSSIHPLVHHIDFDMAYESRQPRNILQAYFEHAGIDIPTYAASIGSSNVDGKSWLSLIPRNYYATPEDHAWASVVGQENKLLVLHRGPINMPGRNPKPEYFHALVEALQEQSPYSIIDIGSDKGSQPLNLRDDLDIDLRGKTTPGQMTALLHRSVAFVGVDSFPLHCALGTIGSRLGKIKGYEEYSYPLTVLGIFGITDPMYILPTYLRETTRKTNKLVRPPTDCNIHSTYLYESTKTNRIVGNVEEITRHHANKNSLKKIDDIGPRHATKNITSVQGYEDMLDGLTVKSVISRLEYPTSQQPKTETYLYGN